MRATGRAVAESSRRRRRRVSRALEEQLRRLQAGQSAPARKPQVRQLEGRDPPDHLARQAQRLAAGGQHSHAGTALKQRHGEFCTGPEQMLAVVEQHYHSPVGKLLHNGRRGGPGAGQRQAKRCRGSRRYQPPVPDPRQVNEPHAVGDHAGVRHRRATSIASRVLPAPPGPLNVSSRVRSARASNSAISAGAR